MQVPSASGQAMRSRYLVGPTCRPNATELCDAKSSLSFRDYFSLQSGNTSTLLEGGIPMQVVIPLDTRAGLGRN
jgi:hypothetical protein